MKDVMGIIYTGENDALLRELTIIRAIAALPVAGRFRVIDFLVSSMVNAGIKNIGVIMQKNYHSLMDHLGSGKEWDLHGKINGLHILPPFLTRENVGLYPGFLDALRSNNDYLTRSKQELLVLSNSNIIYNAHLDEMISIAEKLSKGVPFVRIDLFEVDGRVFFSEFTLCPASGLMPFVPAEYDKIVGDMLDLTEAGIRESGK